LVIELFRELGVIVSPEGEIPTYREDYLCAEPEERLYRLGKWSSGIIPSEPLTQREREELLRFDELMSEHSARIGTDGRPAFSIPLDESSTDREFLDLDRVSFRTFLDRLDFQSAPLSWYVDYCCRDDYGALAQDTSAWAGVHYVASRRGWAANAQPQDVVTWPEGNGWITRRLADRFAAQIRTGSLAHRVTPGRGSTGTAEVEYYDVRENRSVRLRADAVILASPRFVSSRLLGDVDVAGKSIQVTYRPWVVANVFLDGPLPKQGSELAWDNVIYNSPSLGYVVATHQQHHSAPHATVLTYYLPLAHLAPDEARRVLHETPWNIWRDRIIADLEGPHPGIRQQISKLDVWLWGHGMVSPAPGFIWSDARRQLSQPVDRVWFAHSDLSGLSLFEEAQYRGVTAARSAMKVIAS